MADLGQRIIRDEIRGTDLVDPVIVPAASVRELVKVAVASLASEELPQFSPTWLAFLENQRASDQLFEQRDAALAAGLDLTSQLTTPLLIAVVGEVLAELAPGPASGRGARRRRREARLAALLGSAPDPSKLDFATMRARFLNAMTKAHCPQEQAVRLAETLATLFTDPQREWVAIARDDGGKHVFISYVHEDSRQIDELQAYLESAGIRVWRDVSDLWPGQDWRARIRLAITDNAIAFIACFSPASLAREVSYQNEELTLAIDELRLRDPSRSWLLPVRLAECEIPDREIGSGRTLNSLQRIDLFGDQASQNRRRLLQAVERILGNQLT